EAQLDRFLFKHVLDYPDREEELSIVEQHGHLTSMPEIDSFGIVPVADLETVSAMRAGVAAIPVAPDILEYVVDVIRATREDPSLQFGASPRSAATLVAASRAHAAICGRDYVIPDDIKALAPSALRHRVVLAPGAEVEGLTADRIVADILDRVAAPR
ncbi:MAG: AAA family ATPase, partial [bacterium]